MASRSQYGVCSCCGEGRTVEKSFNKLVCFPCREIMRVTRKHPEAVIREIRKMHGDKFIDGINKEHELKYNQLDTLYQTAKKSIRILRERVAELRKRPVDCTIRSMDEARLRTDLDIAQAAILNLKHENNVMFERLSGKNHRDEDKANLLAENKQLKGLLETAMEDISRSTKILRAINAISDIDPI